MSAPPPPSASASPSPVAPANPMDLPAEPIACAPGYIVQVASELTEPGLRARVATIDAAGHLPPQTRWAHTANSCNLFSVTGDAVVLYAGPFSSPYDACPARLNSPADAFIKGTTPETAKQYVSCLCPAQVNGLPTLDTVGQKDVWVGELQRVLVNKLNYSIKDRDGNPAAGVAPNWGIYTGDTAAAISRFQADTGLPVTGAVDAATWGALQSAQC